MKRFIIQILIFISILVALDRSFILFKGADRNIFSAIAVEKMKIVASKMATVEVQKILIVGSSHAQFGISPEVLDKSLGISSMNLAYGGGANVGLQLAMLRKLISKKRIPDVIIFGMDVFTLNAPPIYSDENQSVLFNESNSIREFFNKKVFISYVRLFFGGYLAQIRSGNISLPYFEKKALYDLSMFAKYDKYEISENGWVKGYGLLNKEYLRYSETVFNPDKSALNDLDEYLKLCKNENIKVVFVQVPENMVCLQYRKKYDDFDIWMKHFSKENNCLYWNYDTLESFPVMNDSLFFDSDHLNANGAELLSSKLAEDLKKYRVTMSGL